MTAEEDRDRRCGSRCGQCAQPRIGDPIGQEQIRGQSVLRDVGLERVPIVNVENACASGSSAFREAVIAIRAGVADRVLAVGFEKMFVDDRDRSLSALESAVER